LRLTGFGGWTSAPLRTHFRQRSSSGVKLVLVFSWGGSQVRYLCEPACVDGVVYATTVGEAEMPEPGVSRMLNEVVEVWRDHICIWKRE
jgi:hypothetical protein